MIRLRFVAHGDPISRAIQWFSAGHLSHVDVCLPNGQFLGSRGVRRDRGVKVRPAGYDLRFHNEIAVTVVATQDQEQKFYDFLDAQIGKPYDRWAVRGFVVNREWHDTDAWTCSELVAGALQEVGILPKLYLDASKITPVALLNILSSLSGTVIEPRDNQ